MDEIEVHDAMLATKPLGGWSCASCQKSIFNLNSVIADHTVSSRPPQKEVALKA